MTDWTFDGFGPEFDEHVLAHLPGYRNVQELVAYLAEFLVSDGDLVADYGASTGTTAATIRDAIPGRDVTFWLYDADRSMLDVAAERVPGANLVEAKLPSAKPAKRPKAALTLALWLLQFIPARDRLRVLRELREGAQRRGVLLVATKVRESGALWQEISEAYLDDHKAAAGVPLEARAAKTRALRGAMFPAEIAALVADLEIAGWESPAVLFKLPGWALVAAVAE